MNIEQALGELGQARRDAADPERLRPFINDMELCDLEDLAHKGIARRAVRGGTLYVRWQESGRRYWLEDGCHYVELTREQALERF